MVYGLVLGSAFAQNRSKGEVLVTGLNNPLALQHSLDSLWVLDAIPEVAQQNYDSQVMPNKYVYSKARIVEIFRESDVVIQQEIIEFGNSYSRMADYGFYNGNGQFHPKIDYWTRREQDETLWLVDSSEERITLLQLDPLKNARSDVWFESVPPTLVDLSKRTLTSEFESPRAQVYGQIATDSPFFLFVALESNLPDNSTKVVRVDFEGNLNDYATNFYSLIDLQIGPNNQLYGVQSGVRGEEGLLPNTGTLVHIYDGGSVVVIPGLNRPTALAFNPVGDAYITQASSTDLGYEILKLEGLAAPPPPYSILNDNYTGPRGPVGPTAGHSDP